MSAPPSAGEGPIVVPDGFAEDYEALRHGAAVIPGGRDIVRVSGPDTVEYLQGQCSQDVAALKIGDSADALLLTPQGKLDALVRVTRADEDEMYVDTDAGYGPAVAARLARFKLRVKAEITVLDWHCVSVRGPDAAAVADDDRLSSGAALVVPFRWASVDGVDLFGPGPFVSDGVPMSSPEAWQSVRVESGIPLMGCELDERTIAAEADLLERCVSFTKGCYTGQELVARLDARGNKVARRLRAMVVDSTAGRPPAVHPGADVAVGEKTVGQVTSVAWSGAFDSVVALGYLHRGVEPPSPVAISVATGEVVAAEARVLPLV